MTSLLFPIKFDKSIFGQAKKLVLYLFFTLIGQEDVVSSTENLRRSDFSILNDSVHLINRHFEQTSNKRFAKTQVKVKHYQCMISSHHIIIN